MGYSTTSVYGQVADSIYKLKGLLRWPSHRRWKRSTFLSIPGPPGFGGKRTNFVANSEKTTFFLVFRLRPCTCVRVSRLRSPWKVVRESDPAHEAMSGAASVLVPSSLCHLSLFVSIGLPATSAILRGYVLHRHTYWTKAILKHLYEYLKAFDVHYGS